VGSQSRLLFATRYSLLAAVLPVANRQSPFAVHYSLLAIRYSLPLSARHETRPPTIFRLSGSETDGLKGLTRNLQPSPAFPTPTASSLSQKKWLTLKQA